jgi:hypothetical protein
MLSISNQKLFLVIHGDVLSHLNYVTYMFQIVFNHSSYVSTWYHRCNICLFLYITYHMFFFAQIYDQTRTHTDHTQTRPHNKQHTTCNTHRNTNTEEHTTCNGTKQHMLTKTENAIDTKTNMKHAMASASDSKHLFFGSEVWYKSAASKSLCTSTWCTEAWATSTNLQFPFQAQIHTHHCPCRVSGWSQARPQVCFSNANITQDLHKVEVLATAQKLIVPQCVGMCMSMQCQHAGGCHSRAS